MLDTESKTVALTGLENKNGKKAVVPAAIEYKGVSFQVTAIADKAFYGCKKLTSVTVGENVSSIGKQSFAGCGKLKAVYLKSGNITAIGKKAFAKINGKAKVYVPKKKAAAYKKLLKKAGLKAGAKIVKKAY